MSGKAPRSTILPIAAPAAGDAPRAALTTARADILQGVRRIGTRASDIWLPGLKWRIERMGRPGLAGLVLLGASAVFLYSTHLPVADEVVRLRSDLLDAQTRVAKEPRSVQIEAAKALRDLPARSEMPQVLGTILKQAADAQLGIDTAKYEISTTKVGGLVRYRCSFPI